MTIMRLLCVFFLLLSFFLGWRLVGHEDGWSSYQDLSQRRDALAMQLAEIEQKNIKLSSEIRRLTSDREYLESIIRVEMHYLRPDEVLYIPQNEIFRRAP
jgi:cell division protein FtsB